MLSALSLADRELADRLISESFRRTKEITSGSKTKQAEAAKEAIFSNEVRDRASEVLKSCREMLSTELPERMTEYWGKVCYPRNERELQATVADGWNRTTPWQSSNRW